MPGYLHHVQWSVADVAHISAKLRREYGMRVVATRDREVVLQSGSVVFLISQTGAVMEDSEDDCYPWISSGRTIDCVFNLCLEVGDVQECYERMTGRGSLSISAPRDLSTAEGEVSFAVVSSPCHNVMHSIVNTQRYRGLFLPGFTQDLREPEDSRDSEDKKDQEDKEVRKDVHEDIEDQEDYVDHIDHVTYVCEEGASQYILDWYKETCGMESFPISPEEQPGMGTVIEDVGMKLSVGSWVTEWLCREEGVSWNQQDDDRNFKLVLAEPLPAHVEGHVNRFLTENGGPGVQHIGLSTQCMINTVSELSRRGAEFRKPPPTYYRLIDKQEDILSIGHSLDTFRRLGILIDRQPTDVTNSFILGDDEEEKFLLQIFSFPVFQSDTFFLEIVQRQNSKGFGAGNIRALAQSISEWEKEREKLESSLVDGKTSPTILKTCSHEDFKSFYNKPSQTFGIRRTATAHSNLNVVLTR